MKQITSQTPREGLVKPLQRGGGFLNRCKNTRKLVFPEIVEHHLSMDVNFLNDVSIESMTRIYTSYVKKVTPTSACPNADFFRILPNKAMMYNFKYIII